MPRKTLTELTLRSLKADVQTDYWDASGPPGFGIRVGPRSKTFILKHDNRRYSLGSWPTLSLKDARDAARRRMLEPTNPTRALTFEEAYRAYIETKIKPNYRPKPAAELQRLFALYATPLFERPLSEITAADVQKVITSVPSRAVANYFFGNVRTFLAWCEKRDLCTSPARKLDRPYKAQTRNRVLTEHELRLIWAATQEPTHFNAIIRLCLALGARKGEVSLLRHEWLVGDDIVFPASVTKNGVEFTTPNLPLTRSIISSISPTTAAETKSSSGMLFPARGTTSTPFSGWSKAKVFLDARIAKLNGGDPIPSFQIHDLRRAFAHTHARLGTDQHILACQRRTDFPAAAEVIVPHG